MRIGFGLPDIGPLGTTENVAQVAERAEALGYDSLWTIERLLWPVKPKTPYPATPNGLLPEGCKHSLGPLDRPLPARRRSLCLVFLSKGKIAGS